ncbi:MAG: RNA-binding protein [Methanobacteriaceae archaeon]|nr:RNA-binding protein [Methanobacteriaceae archaeon]
MGLKKLKHNKRYHLKNKKIKEIKKELGTYEILIPPKTSVEMIETDGNFNILVINNEPILLELKDGKIIPTLKAVTNLDLSHKYVTVDMGAVTHIIKGADIMSPGIVDADTQIQEGDIITVIDENHKKPLAIGKSIITGQEMIDNQKGKAIKTLHFVGDEIWDFAI